MKDRNRRDGMKGSLDRPDRLADGRPAPDPVAIDALLAQLALASATRKAPSAVRQRLQAEARLRADRSLSLRPRFAGARRWIGPLAGSAALLAALIVAGGLLLGPGKLATAVHSLSQRAGARLLPGGSYAASAARTPDTEDSLAASSDTFDVPYSDPSIANGTGATVRVSLPDSELLAWGVPSLGREPDDLVPVELTLGDDGLPQAVRLLPAATSTPEEIYP